MVQIPEAIVILHNIALSMDKLHQHALLVDQLH